MQIINVISVKDFRILLTVSAALCQFLTASPPSAMATASPCSRCRLIELQVEYTMKKALQRVQICANFVGLQEQMQKVTVGGQFGGFTVADSSWRVSWRGGESSPSSISVVFDSVYSRNCRKIFAIRD